MYQQVSQVVASLFVVTGEWEERMVNGLMTKHLRYCVIYTRNEKFVYIAQPNRENYLQ